MRAAIALVIALAGSARADDDLAGASVVFQRGQALIKTDARGRGEAELARLPEHAVVRALRTDAAGKVLLADVGGAWSWMPLDGSGALAELPCGDGPAQLAEDGAAVLCRGKQRGSLVITLATGKVTALDIPPAGARLAGGKLVWADERGVWIAPPGDVKAATRAADAPLRGFLASPDGARAVGVYAGEVYTDAHHKKAAELLFGFALDGAGARRKAIKDGVAVEWSHDAAWVLVQDGASACIMKATGGEYKCWKGYTAASIASDGKFALVLGNRDGSRRLAPATAKKKADPDEAADEGQTEATPDVAVAPPTGPLALYRVRLEGSAYTEPPVLVARVVDGAAVWVPAP